MAGGLEGWPHQRGERLRLPSKINKKTEIEVRTGSGVSARGLAGPVTGQGGGRAALASALDLDRGINTYLPEA